MAAKVKIKESPCVLCEQYAECTAGGKGCLEFQNWVHEVWHDVVDLWKGLGIQCE